MKPRLFIQFAGQGMKYMDELRRLYSSVPAVQPFIDEAINAIKGELARYDDSECGLYKEGLAVDEWIKNPQSTPGFAYQLSSPISHCLIYLTQISNYLALVEEGMDHEALQAHVHTVTGFSTGIMAAVLCALDVNKDYLWKRAIDVQKMFFWQGARCQESIFKAGGRPFLDEKLHSTAEGSPSCMASIADIPRSKVDTLIAEFATQGKVYLAYKLTPMRCIVAGLPKDVAAFGAFIKERVEKKFTWRYVPSTIAAHSPLLQHAFDNTPNDAVSVGLKFDKSELKLPVLSNDGGKDLRESDDIITDIMHAYFLQTGLWRNQLAPLFANDGITHVLDFGPGAGVAGLTEMHLARFDIKVVRCSVPLERKMFIKQVLSNL